MIEGSTYREFNKKKKETKIKQKWTIAIGTKEGGEEISYNMKTTLHKIARKERNIWLDETDHSN